MAVRLSQIEGQERAVQQLIRGLSRERVAHAYLFSGPQGVGKRTTARAFAQAVLCLEPREGEACESCASCRQFSGENHPDFFHIRPDGASVKIDQIRNLQKRIRYLPYVSAHQAVIIEQAETMQGPAANALLKILEEPPGPTVFILVTDRGHGILPTILSRCLPVHFQPIPGEAIGRFLRQKGVDPRHIPLLVLLSDGRWDRAGQLAEAGLPPGREKAQQILERLPRMNDSQIFQLAEEWDKNKEAIAEFVDYGSLLLRDWLLLAGQSPDQGDKLAEELIINRDIVGSTNWSLPVLLAGLERVMKTRRLLETNASARLLVEDLLLRLRDLTRK
ncbi:DNA polymerase III subunit delta' [Heliobacillus mobilis]|uniref:DNA polymerase III subunit delta n=1 Tax=Heliobacterium mobile TaxID=28064 RepID=A0A6I3SHT8_HELMO|nr:DNA polymerase III subunit delta' [Heliobacterium mobile]